MVKVHIANCNLCIIGLKDYLHTVNNSRKKMYLKSQWLQVSIGIQQLPNACNITEKSMYSVTQYTILYSVGVLYLEAAMATVKRLQHVFYSKRFF